MLALFFCYLIFEVLVIDVLYHSRERLCDLAALRFRTIAIISASIFFDFPQIRKAMLSQCFKIGFYSCTNSQCPPPTSSGLRTMLKNPKGVSNHTCSSLAYCKTTNHEPEVLSLEASGCATLA